MTRIEPFTESNEFLSQPDKLREQARQDGYLFFRKLIDTDSIQQLRQNFLEICHRHGWAQGGETLMDGIRIGGPFMEGDDGYWPVLDEFQSLESFHAFAHHPAILDMCDKLFGEKTLVHPRNIGRIMFPENTKFTTPAHQDFIHIRGTEETYTAWIPLGDCPKYLGGLTVLSGSHRSGVYPVKPAFGAGGVGIDTDPLEADGMHWVSGDYEIGDALFFHSHAVHKALPNQTPDRIRLSVDYRYQGSSQPVTEGSLLPHFNRMPWEQIYKEWNTNDYQYYWKSFDLNMV
ncbi:MAG: phytanoyl-CoA dioxygenase family protein [Candidatus Poribacteria bacterium]|nr:phytanoyl-CoA dioxygenase family protein [Candidatus Poribacteria bacterium]